MRLTLRVGESDELLEVTVKKNDMVILLKEIAQQSFPEVKGKLLQAFLHQNTTELNDEKFLGEYRSICSGCEIDILISISQPYSEVNYSVIREKLEKNVEKPKLEKFFDPTQEDNDWEKEWTKGEEYLSYPPVDVYGVSPNGKFENIWAEAEESGLNLVTKKVREKKFDKISKKILEGSEPDESRRKMEDFLKEMLNRGRSFKSVYVCEVNGFKFTSLQKLEGKWSGSAVHCLIQSEPQENLVHSCSSKMMFDPRNRLWVEQQLYTNKDGLMNSRVFKYKPVADGVCEVTCDDPRFMETAVLKLRESNEDVLVLTGVNVSTGSTILTETITFGSYMDIEKRTRTITRFNNRGSILGVVVCKEHKVLDEETGAITPSFF